MGKCILCGSNEMYNLYTMNNMPQGAQSMPTSEEVEADVPVSMSIVKCKYCNLVQLDIQPIWYYKDAIRVGNTTPTMKKLRDEEYKRFVEEYKLENKRVIEIGCSTGEYVEQMRQYGMRAYGLEHSQKSCDIARANGLSIFNGYIEGEDYRIDEPFDAFTCYNFLEHQPTPISFLRGIINNLCDDAIGIVTVPSYDYMLQHGGLYEVIRDHLAYYTEETFELVLRLAGFFVESMETINNDTLRAVVRKKTTGDIQEQIQKYDELKKKINSICTDWKQNKKRVAVWGASHQCFTILADSDLGDSIEFIVDKSPIKQGKYSPVSHKKIVGPEELDREKMDAVVIAAPGYAKEIRADIKSRVGEAVQIAVLYEDDIIIEE